MKSHHAVTDLVFPHPFANGHHLPGNLVSENPRS